MHECVYTCIFNLISHPSLFLVFPARAPSSTAELTGTQMALGIEAGEGRSAGIQAGYQLACLATTLGLAIGGGLLTGKCVGGRCGNWWRAAMVYCLSDGPPGIYFTVSVLYGL